MDVEFVEHSETCLPKTLLHLFEMLDRYHDRVPLSVLKTALSELYVPLEQLAAFTIFSDEGYRRNLLYAGSCYHALILCWQSGQRSEIHDHLGSACAVKVLQGCATESHFTTAENGMIFPVRSIEHASGSVCGSEDLDIHQVSNLQPNGCPLVTLHIYSPPLLVMGKYTLDSVGREEFLDQVHQPLYSCGAGI
jgi:cysteine dioxygenase